MQYHELHEPTHDSKVSFCSPSCLKGCSNKSFFFFLQTNLKNSRLRAMMYPLNPSNPSSFLTNSQLHASPSRIINSINNSHINNLHNSMYSSENAHMEDQQALFGIRSNASFSWTDPRILAWIYSSVKHDYFFLVLLLVFLLQYKFLWAMLLSHKTFVRKYRRHSRVQRL